MKFRMLTERLPVIEVIEDFNLDVSTLTLALGYSQLSGVFSLFAKTLAIGGASLFRYTFRWPDARHVFLKMADGLIKTRFMVYGCL